MSSINYNHSFISATVLDVIQKEDDAEFFSVAQEYNERKAKIINPRAMEAMNMIHNFNVKNNPYDPKVGQAKQEKTRKTRSDQEGREYICGSCKSGYLSYPALYTHIKTKHDGITPEGTIRGKNNHNKRRGRPKTFRKQATLHFRAEPQLQFPQIYSKVVLKTELSFIGEDDQQQLEEDDNLTELRSKMFIKEIKELKKMSMPISTLPIIKVMSIFLYNVKEFLINKSETLMTIQAVFEKLVNEINKNHEKILNEFQVDSKYYVKKKIPPKEIYCHYEKCDYMPVFVDYLFKTLDFEDDQLEIDFLSDFCRWLMSKKLTHIRLMKPEAYEAGQGVE